MKRFLKDNSLPLLFYFLLLFTALYFIFTVERNQIHIFINQYVGNRYINALFYYITYLGDGLVAAVIIAVVSAFNIRLGLVCLLSFLFAAMISNGLKYYLFDDVDRPHFIFSHIEPRELKKVEGVKLHIHNSFPSGHATQAFAVLSCLMFASRSLALKMLLLSAALLTCFSRVYLSQHFLTDVTAGSIIGFAMAVVFFSSIVVADRIPRLNRPLKTFRGA